MNYIRNLLNESVARRPSEYCPLDLIMEELEYDWDRGEWVTPVEWRQDND